MTMHVSSPRRFKEICPILIIAPIIYQKKTSNIENKINKESTKKPDHTQQNKKRLIISSKKKIIVTILFTFFFNLHRLLSLSTPAKNT
jgi:hypothetical protein